MRRSWNAALAALAALALVAPVARAAEITVNSGGTTADTDRGALNSQGFVDLGQTWKVASNSWQLRWITGLETTRSYTLFQLPALPAGETIVSATVTFTHPGNSYNSPDASETVTLWSIDSSPFTELRDNSWAAQPPRAGDRQAFFDDLGSGAQYASFDASAANVGQPQTVTLNAQAIAALNAAAQGDGQWGFGASITSGASAVAAERVFVGTGGANNTTPTVLRLQTQAVASGQPVFVDTGYFTRRFNRSSGATVQTQHFGTAALHQSYLSGNNQFGADDVVRRSYFAFDLSGVSEPIASATLRLWASAPSPINGNSGAYGSDNSSERFELRALDSFTPAQVIAAPFGTLSTGHTLNLGIWTDLEDGTVYGGREFTIADEQNPGLIPLPNASPVPDCSVVGTDGCGRFIDIPLNAAGVASLNAATGIWLAGGVVSTIDGNVLNEALWAGSSVDFANPALRSPAPQLMLTAGPANQPPIANAGTDRSATVGTAVQLDGSASSDPDGDAFSYAWTLSGPSGSTAQLSGATTASPSFTPDLAGAYTATLVVTDAAGAVSAPDGVVITAAAQNRPPVARAGEDRTAPLNVSVTLDGSGSTDPDGDPLTYQWALQRPVGSGATLQNSSTAAPSFTPDLAGTYTANLTVFDPSGAFTSDSVVISVAQPNRPPLAATGADQSVAVNAPVALDGSGSSDPDSDALTYAWTLSGPSGSNAALSDANTVSPSFTPDVAGAYTATLTVSDPSGASATDDVVITADGQVENHPPVAEAGEHQGDVPPGTLVQLDGSGSTDEDGDSLTYLWTLSVPPGSSARLSDASLVNPTFTVDRAGEYAAALIVRDSRGAASEVDTVVISTRNAPPTAAAGADQRVQVGTVVQLDGTASSDPNGDEITYAWVLEKPAGSTAVLSDAASPTPTFRVDLAGEYAVALVVTDPQGLPSEVDTLNVSTGNVAPIANAGLDQNVIRGATVRLDGSGSRDADGDRLSYRWSFVSRPAGSRATLGGAGSVQPSFSADVAGTYVVQLLVSDGMRKSEPDTVSITATAAQANACRVDYRGVGRASNEVLAAFSGNARLDRGTVRGEQAYAATRRLRPLIAVRSISTETLQCTAQSAVLTGRVQIVGGGRTTYRIELWDSGRRDGEFYRLRLGNGYDSGKLRLTTGDILIRIP